MPGALEITLGWDFAVRFLSITLIDLALSGDNAIVIGMAAASLPVRQRRWAILGGAGLAIALRVGLTTVASLLLQLPLLSAIGGVVLFWVAWRLLRIDAREQPAQVSEADQSRNFREAILLIVTADFMMSLDNVIAVAGSASGSPALIIAGLIISMPLLMTTGGAISLLIDRFRWLVPLGAAVICFTGTRMILEDRFLESWWRLDQLVVLGIAVAVAAIATTAFRRTAHRRAAHRGAAQSPTA